VYGTPYDMGLAHGQIVKPFVDDLMTEVEKYLAEQVGQALPNLPDWLKDVIENEGVMAALELTYYATLDYTPSYFIDELKRPDLYINSDFFNNFQRSLSTIPIRDIPLVY